MVAKQAGTSNSLRKEKHGLFMEVFGRGINSPKLW